MAEKPADDEAAPKSSADLIREAREALASDAPDGSQASQDLMETARDWLGSTDPGASYQVPAVPDTAVPDSRPTAADDTGSGVVFEPQAWSPAPRRRPSPLPQWPIGHQDPGRQRRMALLLAVAVGLVASVGVVAAVLLATDDEPSTVSPVTISSTGSITSGSDPCSGAEISGDLEATITYLEDPEAPQVTIDIFGPLLSGSDGAAYVLEIAGSAVGSPGQQTFEFESGSMTMTRSDGVVIEDVATITIEIVGGSPDNWSYSSPGGDCPG